MSGSNTKSSSVNLVNQMQVIDFDLVEYRGKNEPTQRVQRQTLPQQLRQFQLKPRSQSECPSPSRREPQPRRWRNHQQRMGDIGTGGSPKDVCSNTAVQANRGYNSEFGDVERCSLGVSNFSSCPISAGDITIAFQKMPSTSKSGNTRTGFTRVIKTGSSRAIKTKALNRGQVKSAKAKAAVMRAAFIKANNGSGLVPPSACPCQKAHWFP